MKIALFLLIAISSVVFYFRANGSKDNSAQEANATAENQDAELQEKKLVQGIAEFLEKNPQIVQKEMNAAEGRFLASDQTNATSGLIPSTLVRDIEVLRETLDTTPGVVHDVNRCNALASEIKVLMEDPKFESATVQDKIQLVDLSFSLAQAQGQGEAKNLLFQQANTFLKSTDPTTQEIGRRALQLYIDAESDSSLKDQRYHQLSQQLGADPLGH